MSITILYFASLREAIGHGSEQLALPEGVGDVRALHAYLATRGEAWQALQRARNLRVAVNQKMADMDAAVRDGDEVAFFPPVTGG